jgi:hypothetical protein
MPIRRSPNGRRHTPPRTPQPARDAPEQLLGINRNDCSGSIGTAARDQPVRACTVLFTVDAGEIHARHLRAACCGRRRCAAHIFAPRLTIFQILDDLAPAIEAGWPRRAAARCAARERGDAEGGGPPNTNTKKKNRPVMMPTPKPREWPRLRQLADSLVKASRMAIAICTARNSWFSTGMGALKSTIKPSPAKCSMVPS